MKLLDLLLKYIRFEDIGNIKNLLDQNPKINITQVEMLIYLTRNYQITKLLYGPTKNSKAKNKRSEKLFYVQKERKEKSRRKIYCEEEIFFISNIQKSCRRFSLSACNSQIESNKICIEPHPTKFSMQNVNNSTQNHPSLDKIAMIFGEAIKKSIPDCNFDQAHTVGHEIALSILQIGKITDKQFIATKKLNISNPKNTALCESVYNREITAERFIQMTPEEMKSEELKKIEKKMLQDNICDIQAPKLQAETTMFKCGKCGQSKTTYYQLQTRSADEPMTNYVTCVVCGNRWKFC